MSSPFGSAPASPTRLSSAAASEFGHGLSPGKSGENSRANNRLSIFTSVTNASSSDTGGESWDVDWDEESDGEDAWSKADQLEGSHRSKESEADELKGKGTETLSEDQTSAPTSPACPTRAGSTAHDNSDSSGLNRGKATERRSGRRATDGGSMGTLRVEQLRSIEQGATFDILSWINSSDSPFPSPTPRESHRPFSLTLPPENAFHERYPSYSQPLTNDQLEETIAALQLDDLDQVKTVKGVGKRGFIPAASTAFRMDRQ